MAQGNDGKLLNELDEVLADAVKDSSGGKIAQPFEAFDDYSTDAISFNDMAKLMMDKVDAVFNLAVVYNRRSSQYLKTAGKLEQGIKYLASGCVTKVALEGKKYDLPDIGQLSTEKLYRMASYHFRKIDRAQTEIIQEKKGVLDDSLLDLQYRYYNLLIRLRATEAKIHNYNSKRWAGEENYDPVIQGLAFSQKSWTRSFNEGYIEPPAFQKARAFSSQWIKDSGGSAVSGQQSAVSGQQSAGKGSQNHLETDTANPVSEAHEVCSAGAVEPAQQNCIPWCGSDSEGNSSISVDNTKSPEAESQDQTSTPKPTGQPETAVSEAHEVCSAGAVEPAQQNCIPWCGSDSEGNSSISVNNTKSPETVSQDQTPTPELTEQTKTASSETKNTEETENPKPEDTAETADPKQAEINPEKTGGDQKSEPDKNPGTPDEKPADEEPDPGEETNPLSEEEAKAAELEAKYNALSIQEQKTLLNALKYPHIMENVINWANNPDCIRYYPDRAKSCLKILDILNSS